MNVMPSPTNVTRTERAASLPAASRTPAAPTARAAPRRVRQAAERYRVEEALGSGSSATVWRAHDTQTGRPVAIKRFHPHLVSDPGARERIEREALAATSLSHPNIISAIDTFSSDGEVALVFPYVEGTSLAERLAAGQRLSAAEATAIAADIAEALAAAHRAGLVHRDVKPANVLIGDDGHARLLDFGISRTLAAGIEAEQALTGLGMTVGTLPYMAPEQLTAEAPTPATDIYALAVLLYEMLAGTRPFAAGSPVALAAEQRVPPARIEGQPPQLVDQVLAALAVEPAARPGAAEFAGSLRTWLNRATDPDAPTAVLPVAREVGAFPLPSQQARARGVSNRQLAGVAGLGLSITAAAVLALGLAGPQPSAIGDASPSPTDATPAPSAAPVAPANVEREGDEQGSDSGRGNGGDDKDKDDKDNDDGKKDEGKDDKGKGNEGDGNRGNGGRGRG